MSKTNYKKNRDRVLSKAREYYKNNRELLKERVKNRCNFLTEDKKQKSKEYQKEYQKEYRKEYQKKYQNKYRSLSEDDKNIKRQYQKNRYHNMSDEEKQRLKDYQKNYREAKKLKLINSNT